MNDTHAISHQTWSLQRKTGIVANACFLHICILYKEHDAQWGEWTQWAAEATSNSIARVNKDIEISTEPKVSLLVIKTCLNAFRRLSQLSMKSSTLTESGSIIAACEWIKKLLINHIDPVLNIYLCSIDLGVKTLISATTQGQLKCQIGVKDTINFITTTITVQLLSRAIQA